MWKNLTGWPGGRYSSTHRPSEILSDRQLQTCSLLTYEQIVKYVVFISSFIIKGGGEGLMDGRIHVIHYRGVFQASPRSCDSFWKAVSYLILLAYNTFINMHIYRKHLHCYIWQIFSFLNKGQGCVTETGSWQWQVLSVYLSFISFRWQFWQYLWQRCLLSTSYDETEWTPGKLFCVGGTNTVKHAYYKVLGKGDFALLY